MQKNVKNNQSRVTPESRKVKGLPSKQNSCHPQGEGGSHRATKGFYKKSFIFSISACVLAVIFAFSAILFNVKKENNFSPLSAQAVSMSSFNEKSNYQLAPNQYSFTTKPYSLTSLVDATTLTNNGYDSSGNPLDSSLLNTKDLVYTPTSTEITAMCNNIFGSRGNENTRRFATATDYARENKSQYQSGTHSLYDSTLGTTNYPLRSTSSNVSYQIIDWGWDGGGVFSSTTDKTINAIRPVLNFNLNAILSAMSDLNIKIDETAKTIVVPNIMFPQTKVEPSSTLETQLETAYNGGTLQNGMTSTGITFIGYQSDSSISNRQYNEYLYQQNYYARYVKNENGANITTTNYAWFKVEPIVWYITNWSKMPKSINPSGDETATQIAALSQYALTDIGIYYSNTTDDNRALWQNSRYRAYLNGYDLSEQNNGSNGNATYNAPIIANASTDPTTYNQYYNFKNNGFAQTVWHDLKPSLITPTSLTNNGFDSSNTAINTSTNNLNTSDYAYIPTLGEVRAMNTKIGQSNNPLATPTNYSRTNGLPFWGGKLSSYGTDGTTWYWFRSVANNTRVDTSTQDAPNTFAVDNTATVKGTRPALSFSLDAINELIERDPESVSIVTQEGYSGKTKVLTIKNIMYPNTQVASGSALETALKKEYNNGNLTNKIKATGVTFAGLNSKDQSNTYNPTYSGNDAVEYIYENNYYARRGNVWFYVEPIEWFITNWSTLPTSFTGEATGGSDTTIIALSKWVLVALGQYYYNTTDNYCSMWQNSRYRAYLNGYDLYEENTYGNGNANYKSAIQTSFKGQGFIDTLWHEKTEALITPIKLQNNGFDSSNNPLTGDLTTTDLVWLPSTNDASSDPTSIYSLFPNNNSRKMKTTDWTIANKALVYNSNSNSSPDSFLRSAAINMKVCFTGDNGNVGTNQWPDQAKVIRPGMKFNLTSVENALSLLNIQINKTNKTITIPNLMYPQTKVVAGSALEQELNSAYGTDGTNLQNGMIETGITYIGTNADFKEYLYKKNYYVYASVNRDNSYTLPFSDGSTPSNGNKAWFKVEPISWYVTNWNTLPSSFTGETNGGTDSFLYVISEKAIVAAYKFYPNDLNENRNLWQNSTIRAYLNGYDLSEQNNGTNGNASYKAAQQANFKGKGFIDTIWHDLQAESLADILDKTTIDNKVYTSADDLTGTSTQTSDYIYIPSESELNSYFSTNKAKIVTPTDYALANKANLDVTNNSTYNSTQGSTFYWLRDSSSSTVNKYVDYSGRVSSSSPMHSHNASLLALNFNVQNLLNSNIAYTLNSVTKQIVFPNIMYPQTKVARGSELETNLNSAYTSPTTGNSLATTGRYYAGITTYNGSTPETTCNVEYLYKGEYYVRVKVTKYNSSYAFSDGDSTTQTGDYIWVKVEPIVWNITNWNDLPSALTKGLTSGSATTISCLSQYSLVCIGYSYPNITDNFISAWQNSVLRAFLNGYDLSEQNSGSNGEVAYKSAYQASFKGLGFVDSIWHAYLPNLN